MKAKRLLCCALALVMALSLAVVPASAATTFPDIENHWARSYIEDMTAANMFKGYEDGTFRPENKLTVAEALALCARAVGLGDTVAGKILEDRTEELDDLLDGAQSWFYREFAICLETGILTHNDLKNLIQSKQLTEYIPKEQLAIYMVRAMQLGQMAERLTSYDMGFVDNLAISSGARPYVYLLNIYGIVQGDEKNAFSPRLEVNRAVMSTMLSRCLNFMKAYEVQVDLPDYDTYAFDQGVIAAKSESADGIVLLTLNNDLTGMTEKTISLPADAVIYENNMRSVANGANALKPGRHVRVANSKKGVPQFVRVSAPLEIYDAEVQDIEDDVLTVSADGRVMTFRMDRYTQVQVGARSVGDRTIVDPDAGYTGAYCQVDDQGRLVSVRFTGGTRQEEGIFSRIEKGTGTSAASTIYVIGFDGTSRSYTMPAGAGVTVNGLSGTLNNSYEGCYVSMRVSNEDGSVAQVAVDSVTEYVQGIIKSVGTGALANTLSVTPTGAAKATSYNVGKNCAITYNGETVTLKGLDKDGFVTMRIAGSEVVRIDAWPGSTVVEGIITNRTINTVSASITLQVTQADDTVVAYDISLSDQPTVERNKEKSSVDKLKVGDQVEITVRFNAVSKIVATPQTANMVATIDSILQTQSGYTLNLVMADGETASYSVAAGISVTQAGKEIDVTALKPGYRVGLVLNGDQVTSIEVQQAVNTANRLSGTVLYVNDSNSDRYLLLRVVDALGQENTVRVNVSSKTTMLNTSGSEVYYRNLATGDVLEIIGTAKSASEFDATIILIF